MALPPGPRQPVSVQTMRWIYRPGPFMEDCRRRYGDVFTIRLPMAGDIVFLAHPDAIKETFRGDPEVFRAGEAAQTLDVIFGNSSILLLDGPEHMRQRKLMLPPFHGERLQRYGAVMREIVDEDLAGWPRGAEFSLHERLQAITLEVIMRTVFGFDDPAARARLRDALVAWVEASLSPWNSLPYLRHDLGEHSPWGRFLRRGEEVDRIVYDEIEERRRDPRLEERDDVFSMLLLARDEAGEPMTPQELRDEMLTLLLAGHETTATALAWAFNHLLRQPEQLERLVAEARAGEGMDYAEAVAQETLRLRPPIPIVGRILSRPVTLAGWDLPAGVAVAPCIYLVHRREDLYPDPYEFRPERFLENGPETYTWIPFGGGVRRCLGGSFAIYEMKVLLHAILARADLRAEGERELMRRRAIVFAPERGTQVVLDRLLPRQPAREPAIAA